jgi:hypothetical protein
MIIRDAVEADSSGDRRHPQRHRRTDLDRTIGGGFSRRKSPWFGEHSPESNPFWVAEIDSDLGVSPAHRTGE